MLGNPIIESLPLTSPIRGCKSCEALQTKNLVEMQRPQAGKLTQTLSLKAYVGNGQQSLSRQMRSEGKRKKTDAVNSSSNFCRLNTNVGYQS